MARSEPRDLTRGPIPTHIVKLATPVVVAMALQSAYALIDLAWVRGLGADAVTGLATSFQAFFIVLALAQVVAVTELAELSQAYGAGRIAHARRLFSSYSLVGAAIGLVSAVAAYFSAEVYVSAYTSSPGAHAAGVTYFEVMSVTFFAQLVIMVFGNAVRASGDFSTPMRVMVVSVLVNAGLDPLLMYGIGPFPELGIAGAAWATVVAQILGIVIYSRRFLRRDRLGPRDMTWARPVFPPGFFRRLATRGLPAGTQFFLTSAVLGIVMASLKDQGDAWTSAAGAGFRVMQQTFLPLVALGSAAAAISGQNLGARHHDRVREVARLGVRWALGYAVVVGTLLYFGGGVAAHVFAKTDEGLAVGAEYFRWSAPAMPAMALTFLPMFILQAAGRAILPLLSAILRVALLAVAVVYVVPALTADPGWTFGAVTVTAYVEAAGASALLALFVTRLVRGGAASTEGAPAS
ncbi:MAG: MATE family efflux transporter [Deltaproteobacteria bacterium]|nr:MAG: MATE family efflux transporter [Deltaproteobacteria bacterium]